MAEPAGTEIMARPGGEEPPATVLLRLATAYQASRALHVAAGFGLGDAFARYAADPALSAAMNAGLTALSTTVAQAIVAAYDFSAAERLVDVGGGQGQLLAAILRAN